MFDKGRRAGGRVATRQVGATQFEHGARYVTAGTAAFRTVLTSAGAHATRWRTSDGEPWWIGVPGMAALAGAIATSGIGDLLLQTHVLFLHAEARGWLVRYQEAAVTEPGTVAREGGDIAGPFDAVVLALPAPQAAGLLYEMEHGLAERVNAVTMKPCWAYLVAYPNVHPGPDLPACDETMLEWLSRDSARPGRTPHPECWTAHASPAWSLAHINEAAETVQAVMRDTFVRATGIRSIPCYAAVHRWRYAFVERPLGAPCLSGSDGLVVCGDWCLGPGAEAAFLSGEAAADALIG